MDRNESSNELQQKKTYRILANGGTAVVTEKKSKFIAVLSPVQNEEEAIKFVEETRKTNWDASHNCYAYVIGEDSRLTKCHDDGEPGLTAGRPMLEVLLGAGITNVVCVVTRYFGGTLLGTGGLVRAYSQAVKEALKVSVTAMMRYGTELRIETDYNGIGKILYLLEQRKLKPLKADYTDVVTLLLLIPDQMEACLVGEITEATAGKIKVEAVDHYFYEDRLDGSMSI